MDIVLYVLDSLRPDFLGCYNDGMSTSPVIDSLAEESAVFENAYATSTWTKASASSIFTGEYHPALNMTKRFSSLPSEVRTLPERLESVGFTPYGVSSNTFISDKFGFTDGFEAFEDLQNHYIPDRKETPAVASDTDLVVPQAEDLNKFLFDIVGDEKDRLLFLWSVDTHDPYFVRGEQSWYGNTGEEYIPVNELESYVEKNGVEPIKSLYKDMIRYNDQYIGDIINRLKNEGRYEDALVIVTSDHGESFGEHGEISHAGPVFQEQIKVPLLVKFPEGEFGGKRVDTPVSLVDLVTTILSEAGTEDVETPDGRSLRKTITGGNQGRCVYASSEFSSPHSRAFWWDEYKYLSLQYQLPEMGDDPRTIISKLLDVPAYLRWRDPSVFNLREDPGEQHSLGLDEEPGALRDRRQQLTKNIENRSSARPSEYWDPSENERERTRNRLKHLGYIE